MRLKEKSGGKAREREMLYSCLICICNNAHMDMHYIIRDTSIWSFNLRFNISVVAALATFALRVLPTQQMQVYASIQRSPIGRRSMLLWNSGSKYTLPCFNIILNSLVVLFALSPQTKM